jgi:hypothetical protein
VNAWQRGICTVVAVATIAIAATVVGNDDPVPPTARGDDVVTVCAGTTSESIVALQVAIVSASADVVAAEHEGPPAIASAHDLLAQCVANLDAGDDGAHQVLLLRDLLRAHPDIAPAFAETVLAPARSEQGRLRLLQALEWAGCVACQDVLRAIAATAPASLGDSVLRALGGVSSPTEATIDLLWSHAKDETGTAHVATSAFARAAASVSASHPQLHSRCCEQLRWELRRATGPDRVGKLLRALATAGDPRAADDALVCLGSPDAAVRAVAVDVLLGVAGPLGELAVRDILFHEPDAEVRRIVVRGLALRAG